MSSEGPAKGEPTEGPAKDEDVAETMRDSIDQIDLSVNTAAENGLFEEAKKRDKTLEKIFDDILNKLNEAKENLSKEKYPYAKIEKNISEATEYYSRALYAPSRTWRFVNMYGIYVWFYLIGILAAVFFVFFYGSGPLTKGLHIDQAALNAAGWGVIAAVVRALWFLRGTVDENRYRKSWNLYFMSIPFIGGILGSIVYLIIIGGLLAVSTTTITTTNITTTNTTAAAAAPKTITATPNPLAIIPFAILAGYNWEWAINILNRIGELVETRPPPDRRSKPPITK
jgi:hypothetical protein